MNLVECFDMYNCDKGSRKHRYDRVYEPALANLWDAPFRMLEVGVFKGASLQAWVEYFPNASFVGIDIFERVDIPNIPILNHPRVSWVQCDSTEPVSGEFKNLAGRGFDVIIDDGLHTFDAQRQTFENLIPFLKEGGVYFIEDVWPFHLMTAHQKQHRWMLTHPNDFSDAQYDQLIKAISPYNVKFHDLRNGFDPDTFIIEVRK